MSLAAEPEVMLSTLSPSAAAQLVHTAHVTARVTARHAAIHPDICDSAGRRGHSEARANRRCRSGRRESGGAERGEQGRGDHGCAQGMLPLMPPSEAPESGQRQRRIVLSLDREAVALIDGSVGSITKRSGLRAPLPMAVAANPGGLRPDAYPSAVPVLRELGYVYERATGARTGRCVTHLTEAGRDLLAALGSGRALRRDRLAAPSAGRSKFIDARVRTAFEGRQTERKSKAA